MCDQDQFEQDRQKYEARGLVTRRQFGVLVGAGIAMMLPQAANAVAVTESDVNVMTPRTAPPTAISCTRIAARPQAFSCGPTSSGCDQHSARWGSGSPNRGMRCLS